MQLSLPVAIAFAAVGGAHSYANGVVEKAQLSKTSQMNQLLATKSVLVTGATGFVGLRTISKLVGATDIAEVAVAVRAPSHQEAHDRMHSLIEKHPHLGIQNHIDRLRIIHYDGARIPVQRNTDALLNLGSDTSWTKPLDQMMTSNHDPIINLIKKGRAPKHVVHCSTAYACPLEKAKDGYCQKEESFPKGKRFFSPYAEAKYRVERVIENVAKEEANNSRFSIVRPSAVGASTGLDGVQRGWTTDHKSAAGMYLLTHPELPLVRKLDAAPIVGPHRCHLIPVDFVANMVILAMYESILKQEKEENGEAGVDKDIQYFHATPDANFQNPTLEGVIRTYNKDIAIVNDSSDDLLQYKKKNVATASAEVLLKITSVPFLFESRAQKRSLGPMLTQEEEELFPTGWIAEDNVFEYINDSAQAVVSSIMAAKQAKKGKAAVVGPKE